MRIHAAIVFLSLLVATISDVAIAQPRVARVQPDALGPGMTIALEILSREIDSGAFGQDGIAPNDVRIVLNNPADSNRVVFGPHVVSWNGRLIQVPVMVPLSAPTANPIVYFHIERGVEKSDSIKLHIVEPGPPIAISGSIFLGNGTDGGSLTDGNTLVVKGLDISSTDPTNNVFRFAIDSNGKPLNKRLHPVTILSRGPIRIHNTTLSASADSINGGPGGGGGGAGYVGTGGYGYTGGGSSDTEFVQPATNVGSAPEFPGNTFGGSSTTRVRGGKSDESDQGGGGGTGNPFGTSGTTGALISASFDGGYGGGSAGGERQDDAFGGGGGGFGTKGEKGNGEGDNGGKANGGKFLVPMMGGSGGGGGNSSFRVDSFKAGSGGGGGGAMSIISYHSLTVSGGARVVANGADGKAGTYDREGGGGAGSGGAMLIGARGPIDIQNAFFTTRNGFGGNGGGASDSSARGGNGGIGRIRFDGLVSDTCQSCTGQTTYGPTLTVPTTPLTTNFIKLSGFAGIGNHLSDEIRIYYRTRHTSWTRVDTVRKRSGAVFIWEKFIPAPPDSLLFVCVYAKVNTPQTSFANYDPQWLMGHLSSGVIPIKPRSELVVSPDSLNLGCTKTDTTCLEGLVYIENRGEAPLTIDTIYTEPPLFNIKSAPASLNGYDPKTITIEYCPKEVRFDTAQLVIVIAGKEHRKTILFGCGLDQDRRVQIDNIPDFPRTDTGACNDLNFKITSVGQDAVTIDLGTLFRPPFQIIEPQTPVITLAPKDIVTVRVQFCPLDSGVFTQTFIITERRDSFVLRGVGIRRILFAPDTFWLGEHCLRGACIDTSYLVYAVGNEVIKNLTVVADPDIVLKHPLNPQDLAAKGNEKVEFRICLDSVGDRFTAINYVSDADADSRTKTLLHYRVNGLLIDKDDSLDLGAICSGSCDSVTTSIKNLRSRFTIASVNVLDSVFKTSTPQLPYVVNENDSFVIKLNICPPSSGKFFDTLVIRIDQGECDSTIFIPLRALSSDVALVLSGNPVVFDPVDSGSCVRDTTFLQNPCKTDLLVTLPTLSGVFTRIEPTSSLVTIAGGSEIALIYEFCPTDSILHLTEDTIFYNGSSIRVALSGKGRIDEDIDPPFIRFTLGHVTNAIVPETFDYTIDIDSIFQEHLITTVSGDLLFDPIVALPLSISADTAWTVTGNETQPGLYHFTATRTAAMSEGSFATIRMQALRSRRDTTNLILVNTVVDPQGLASADTGSIKTNACAAPPPNIIIPGEYILGDPTPNPLRSVIVVPVKMGAEGMLSLKLYNAQGAIVFSKTEHRAKGEHQLSVDALAIPPGFYILEAESWGWRERKNVLIVK